MQSYASYTKSKYAYKEKIPEVIRRLILAFAFDGEYFRCRYCYRRLKSELFMGGIKLPTVSWIYHCDHIIAEIMGGETAWHNFQALCEKCNLSKKAYSTFHSKVHAFIHNANIDYSDPLPEIRTLLSFFASNEGNKYDESWTEFLLPVDMREREAPFWPVIWGFDEESETTDPQTALALNLATKTRNLINFLRVCKNSKIKNEVQETYYELTDGIEPVDFWNYVAIDLLKEWSL